MIIKILQELFTRDLLKLKVEINLYQNEENLWLVAPGIANSGGNLCLHLLGNLNAYIGAEIGKTGYIRDRPLEFSQKNTPKEELIARIEATIPIVHDALESLIEFDLEQEYPLLVFAERRTYAFFLTHLATHLAYHIGQINYHRRLLE
jgi:uncharacterized damage-inducible protein DinB